MSILNIDQLVGESDLPVVDVRSPGEFRRGHIPGAFNVPLFDDDERAEIGKLYKQVGREQAIKSGLEIAGAKASQIVESVKQVAFESEFVLHCWRGGMRSRGVAWLCEECGLRPKLVEGGYKSFRQLAHRSFQQPRHVIILAGQTGAGKTRLLGFLRESGQQVIDLEALARHRGSVFGGIDREPQPTVEQFENNLFVQWHPLSPEKPVWIEGESRAIGHVMIPQPVWQQMSSAPTIFVEVERDTRIDFLIEEYGNLPGRELASAMERLKKRLGGARLKAALVALGRNDRRAFASLALEYYDKSYSKSLEQRPRDTLIRFPLSASGDPTAVSALVSLAEGLTNSRSNDFRDLESPVI